MPRRPTTLLSMLAVAAAGACGSPPPPETPTPAASTLSRCPLPVLRRPGRTQPSRIRLENRTADTLDVWMDRCFWHSRLARIPPGGWRQPELPSRLVAFPEGLRFQAYVTSRKEHLGTFTVPMAEEPVLRLVLSDSSAAAADALARFEVEQGQGQVGGFAVADQGDGGYAAVFASSSPAILSWTCDGDGTRHLVLGTGRKYGEDDVEVRLRVDGGEWEEMGRWELSRGLSDAAVAPRGRVDELTRKGLAARELTFALTVPGVGAMEAHAFEVEGLAEALATRACFRELLPPDAPAPPTVRAPSGTSVTPRPPD